VSRSAYWTLVTILIVFGFLGVFSIGAPFLLLGLLLAVLGPVRHYRRVLWPAVAGLVGATVAYALVAPLSCTATSTTNGESSTVCSSILGGTYAGTGIYNPSLEPALRVAAVAAVVAAMLTWIVLSSELRTRKPSAPSESPRS
jgi:hypothetical protein